MTLENLSFPGMQRGRDVWQGAGSMSTLASPASPSAARSVAIALAMTVALTALASPSEISTGSFVSPTCSRALRPGRAGPPDSMSFICGGVWDTAEAATTGGRVLAVSREGEC